MFGNYQISCQKYKRFALPHLIMNNKRKAIFLILLFSLSLLPTTVNAVDAGRYAQYTTATPSQVAEGGTVEIEAYVTGQQYWNGEYTRYNIWAQSPSGERYAIGQNIDHDGQNTISKSWLVPESIPSGYYAICVEESDTGDDTPYETCDASVNIIRYQIDLEVNNEILLPGDTVRVWATVSSPKDGSPEIPKTSGWSMIYDTGESMWDSEQQVKYGVLTPESENEFGMLLPSNIVPSSSLRITFYANDTSGSQQFSEASMTIQVGDLVTSISMPTNNQQIPINSDFLLQINCKRQSSSWMSMPEANLALTAFIEQGTTDNKIKEPVSISSNLPGQPSAVVCDNNGHVSLLITAERAGFTTGNAQIAVYWLDPFSNSEARTSRSIYLSEDVSESLNGVGIDLVIDGPLTSSNPGDEITLTANALDMAGNSLPGVWIHYQTAIETDNGYEDLSKWTIEQSNSQGKLNILLTIPEDAKAGTNSINLIVKAKNETGIEDRIEHQIRLIEPQINLYRSTMNWLTGDQVDVKINSEDMTGNIAVFWNVEDLELEGDFIFAADSQGSFSFTVPERLSQDISSFRIGVTAIDSSGETGYDDLRLYKLDGFSLMVMPPSGVLIAGETISVDYVISEMDPDEPVEYPIQWYANIMGITDSTTTGFINDASGSIDYTVPSYLVSGTYLLTVNFGSQATYLPVEVRSDEDAEGVSGTFSSVADSLDSASGWVSTLALVLAFACLLLLLKRGGGKKEEWSSFNEPLPIASPIAAPPAPPTLPPVGIPEYDPTSPTGYSLPPQY